ncbi:MAG: tetratricopeptide repeat protein [Bacteroidota bacterium]|nr:tetratricopeptide repeat protein [Bacteroidota bacterium]
MKIVTYIICALLFSLNAAAQKENKHIREGNNQYEKGEYSEAQTNYLKAIDENNTSFNGAFNLGNSLYKQEKYEEAASQFKTLSQTAPDKEAKAKAFHNLGNSLLKEQKFEESIDAYKNALRNNPSDNDTRYNLAYAMQQLKQQQEQEKENKEKEKKEDKKEEEKKDEKQDQKKEDQKKEEKEQQKPKDQMSKEEAQRLLEAMEREDKNVQEKLKKQKTPVRVDIEKDW